MGPSRSAASRPCGQADQRSGPAAWQGYGPPPHVKPHSATLTTAAGQPAPLLTQNQVCTELGMLHTLISPVLGFALPYTPLARCSPGAQAERSPRHCLVL